MKSAYVIIGLCFCSFIAQAQTLPQLLKQAEANYPLLKAKRHQVEAQKNQVALVKSSALPSLDAAYQVNFATYNNITGMAVANSFVPISGPPSTDNVSQGVFGSAAGLLLNWEPFTFGQRQSKIESAKANQAYHEADAAQEIFYHQIKTANAYLDVVLMNELLKVYSKNLERAQNNERIIRALTVSGLRPGTDTALFKAELSRARIDFFNGENRLAASRLTLAELLGGDDATYSIDSLFFSKLPTVTSDAPSNNHPLLQLSSTRVTADQSQKISLKRTLYPRLSVWGTTYARGSGIRYDGLVNSSDGLSFSRYNYGLGVMLSVPLLKFSTLRHQLNAQESLIQSEQERLNHITLQLNKQNQIADVTLANALKIAVESPSFYNSAEFSYRTLLSRYNAGLTNYSDLMQAQYALIQSETDLKRTYLDAWKALLYKAATQGDLNVFLSQITNP